MRRVVLLTVVVGVVAWALVPAVRAGQLVARRTAIPDLAEMLAPLGTTEAVAFTASDGVSLAGSYVDVPSAKGVVILVHGFKTYRQEMVLHAQMLHDAGYAVLLYDSRGCGQSDGVFGVGATEYRDIIGAVSYVVGRGALPTHVAVLGISLGAGDALLAAAEDTRIQAVIADSSWPDEQFQLDRMRSLPVGSHFFPLLPYEPALVDAIIGGRLEDASPLAVVSKIAPRSVLLIHSLDGGAQALFDAAGQPKQLWFVPSGGHAGALRVHPDEYRRRVLSFLETAFK